MRAVDENKDQTYFLYRISEEALSKTIFPIGGMLKPEVKKLAEKKGLKNLSLSRTKVAKLPEDLAAWKSLHSLQLGELNLPAAEMARVRKALPDVAIVF